MTTCSVCFLLRSSVRSNRRMKTVVLDLLSEADRHQRLAQELAPQRGTLWRELAIRAARVRLDAQMMAADAALDFDLIAREYIQEQPLLRVGGDPANEVEHFYICLACGQAVDKRDLGEVFHHEMPGHEPLPTQ